mmetsp:Transcript_3613/g.8209  ORF Transcript_3613/g.8209 Transcript_3613/m.8209 type:complete len:310 (+) Transcript_3613:46-975(+)
MILRRGLVSRTYVGISLGTANRMASTTSTATTLQLMALAFLSVATRAAAVAARPSAATAGVAFAVPPSCKSCSRSATHSASCRTATRRHRPFGVSTFSPAIVTASTSLFSTAPESAADGSLDSEAKDPVPVTLVPQPPNSRGGRGGRGGRGVGGKQQQQQRRRFSSTYNSEWKVPNKITIPEDRLEVSFVRSSGAGGQNVNKLSTKVEIRFLLDDATWIPGEVRNRIKQNEANRVNKEGYITVTSQEYRTQAQNRKDVIKKLENIILRSYPRPKVRKMRKGVSKKAKERKKENKKRNSLKKASRRSVDF